MVVVSPMWRELGNTHVFVLDGKSYRQGKATAQAPNVFAVSGVRTQRCFYARATSLLSRVDGVAS